MQYIREKLRTALHILATGQGDARARVTQAFEHLAVYSISEDDFPPELRGDWRWVAHEATKFGPLEDHQGKVWRGSVENTMRRRRNSAAQKIAQRIWRLYWAISNTTEYD